MLPVENIIIFLLFLGAVAYLVNLFRQNFSRKSAGCAKGCGSCGAIQEVEKSLNAAAK